MRHRATCSIALYRLLQMKREKVIGMPATFPRFIPGDHALAEIAW